MSSLIENPANPAKQDKKTSWPPAFRYTTELHIIWIIESLLVLCSFYSHQRRIACQHPGFTGRCVSPHDKHPRQELGCNNHARTLQWSTSPTPSSFDMHPCALAEVRDVVEVPEVVLVFAREGPALTRRCQRWSLIRELSIEVTDVFFSCQSGNEWRRNSPLQKSIPVHSLQRKKKMESRFH